MLVATLTQTPDAGAQRALVDSMALDGCCVLPPWINFSLAQAYERSGDEAGALRALRRGVWYNPPRNLSTQLREEGRIAARLGDRTGAIRAYEHYLALRSDPEPALRPARDSVRSELNRLKRGR
jgi:tetratricopeptide (TPR) repeat protein